jgi:hypothetical protein
MEEQTGGDKLYENLPLSLNPRTIRLLSITASSNESDICAELKLAEVRDGLDYTAVSYVWGDPSPYASIIVNGHKMNIAKNLTIFLRQLLSDEEEHSDNRGRNERVYGAKTRLWIDALCLNQNDVKEKEQQVPLMADVYGRAPLTCIWIGPASENSGVAMDLVDGISDQDFLNYQPDNPSWGRWVAHRKLFEREWWWRVWTVQESILSPNPIVKCGAKEILMERFVDFEYLRMKHADRIKASSEKRGVIELRHYMRTPYRAFLWKDIKTWLDGPLIWWFPDITKFSATKPRDKVYGILSLLQERSRKFITVDYTTKTDADVFIEATVLLLKELGFRVLSDVTEANARSPGLPSWCPEWRKSGRILPSLYHYYDAFFELQSSQGVLPEWCMKSYYGKRLYDSDDEVSTISRMLFSTDLKILAVRGLCLDTIDYVDAAPAIHSSTTDNHAKIKAENRRRDEETLASCKRWRSYVESAKTTSYGGGLGLKEAFWRTICVDAVFNNIEENPLLSSESANSPRSSETFEKQFDAWMGNPCESAQNLSPEELRYYVKEYKKLVVLSCLGRKFITTKKGYIGLASGKVEVGDTVVAVRGGRVPLVLRWLGGVDLKEIAVDGRKAREEVKYDPLEDILSGHWNFVGDCYLHGIMHGEYTKGVDLSGLKEFWIE